jgi:hypothetical protein
MESSVLLTLTERRSNSALRQTSGFFHVILATL